MPQAEDVEDDVEARRESAVPASGFAIAAAPLSRPNPIAHPSNPRTRNAE
jgi:hypothetical protein